MQVPTFADLPNPSGKTIEFTVHVLGAGKAGQVDFVHAVDMTGKSAPKAVHVATFGADGVARGQAPENFPEALYLVATSYSDGKSVHPGDPVGGYPEKVQIGTEDVNLEITIGNTSAWMKTAFETVETGIDPSNLKLPTEPIAPAPPEPIAPASPGTPVP